MLEKEIQQPVIRYATLRGVPHIRLYFGPGMRVGWPDVLFLIPGGIALFIEFKATGKRPTAKQRLKITLLIGLGFACHVCDNIEEGKKIIDSALRNRSHK